MAVRVAIIEDDKNIREMYSYKFNKDGFNVKTAETAAEGFKLAKEFLPEVLLLDLTLPDKPGQDLLKDIRSQIWGKDMKVIILTNTGREDAPTLLDTLEISRYIVKVEDTAGQLEDIVNEVLTKQ